MSWYAITTNSLAPPKKKARRKFNGAWQTRLSLKNEPINVIIQKGYYPAPNNEVNPVTGEAVTIPFGIYQRHTKVNPFRTFMCTAHKGSCKACELSKDDDNITRRQVMYFSAIVLEEFIVSQNEYGDETWHMAKDLMPQQAAELQQGGAEMRFGRKMYLDLGPNHSKNLLGLAGDIRFNCHCGGKTSPSKYRCGSCGNVLEDIMQTKLGKEDFLSLANQHIGCGNCGTNWYPTTEHSCTQCNDPNPWELFDVVLSLCKRGENTASAVLQSQNQPILPAYAFNLPNGKPLYDMDNGAWNELVADIIETPLNFEEIFETELEPEYQLQTIFAGGRPF